jgi:hypothetical protein
MKLQTLKNLRYKPLAAAIAATLLGISVAHADPESGKLKLAGFVDAAEGTELIDGDYAAVIDRLAPHSFEFDADEVAASTNLCVAYVAMGRLDEAHDACDEAIKLARMDQRSGTLQDHIAYENAVAVAYANRAVLTKLSGE